MKKKTPWILGIALAGLVALAGTGCKKEEAPKMPTRDNVQINLPKLREVLANGGPDVQNLLAKVNFGVRYGKYMDALMALDKLKDDPSLNDAQKKVVTEVLGEIQQAAKNQEAAKAPQ
ncbi:MAG: hypothetical protein ABSF95_02655 [Verrucomicrobiota bacterium]|jgi:hypothetical protein